MGHQLVEALVVKRGHQLSVGGRAVGLGDAQRPFLLLAGCQSVAEGLPLHVEVHVGHGALYVGAVFVGFAVLHPGEGEQQSVAILLAVEELAVEQFVRQVYGPALQQPVAADDAVDHVHVLVRRTGLHGDGSTVHGEASLVAGVEPAAGVGGWPMVVEREHHEVLLQRVLLAGGKERVLAALQLRNGYQLVRGSLLPALVVEAIAHLSFKVDAGGVLQVEGHLRVALVEHLLGQRGREGRLAVAQRQRHGSLMGLAGLVGDVGREHEVVEHGVARLGQHHGHVGRELSALVGRRLALGHHLVVRAGANVAHVPVA